jgi:hypothetical protein
MSEKPIGCLVRGEDRYWLFCGICYKREYNFWKRRGCRIWPVYRNQLFETSSKCSWFGCGKIVNPGGIRMDLFSPPGTPDGPDGLPEPESFLGDNSENSLHTSNVPGATRQVQSTRRQRRGLDN